GSGNWWFTFGLFNLLNLAIHAGISYLLWRIAKLIPSIEPKIVLYLYSWSPLVVLQFLVNAHNDIIMASLILLAFYLLLRGRVAWSLPALVAAGFVKYAAFAIMPFAFLFVLRRHGSKAAAKTLGLSAIVGAAVSLPYIWGLPGFKVQQVIEQFTDSTGSLHTF